MKSHDKIRRAYINRTGCKFTAADIQELVECDTAILDAIFPDREGGFPKRKQPTPPTSPGMEGKL